MVGTARGTNRGVPHTALAILPNTWPGSTPNQALWRHTTRYFHAPNGRLSYSNLPKLWFDTSLYTLFRIQNALCNEVCLNRGNKEYPISDQIRLRGESENTPNYKESQLHQKACTHIHTTRTDSTPHHQRCCSACCSSRLVPLLP